MTDAKYYYLKKGDIIQEGDEVDVCPDGWRGDPRWEKVLYLIGKPTPDPLCPSHSKFRREITEGSMSDKSSDKIHNAAMCTKSVADKLRYLSLSLKDVGLIRLSEDLTYCSKVLYLSAKNIKEDESGK